MADKPMVAPATNSKIPEPLAFRVRKENWSRYTTHDRRVEIGVRSIALAFAVGPPPPPGINLPGGPIAGIFQQFQTTFAAPEFRGKPTIKGPPTPADIEKLRERGIPIPFEKESEPDNEYVIIGNPDRIFTTRLVVTGMTYVPGAFAQDGNPIILCDSGIITGRPRFVQPGELGT